VRHLGIERLMCVSGGSMGGMQVLQWAVDYPEMVLSAIPIATAAQQSSQGIAFDVVGRRAIMSDPNWRGGNYYGFGDPPLDGLALARNELVALQDWALEVEEQISLVTTPYRVSREAYVTGRKPQA